MDIRIQPSIISGDIYVPASKSEVHRYLIASALSNANTKLVGNIQGEDVEATIMCLNRIGATITRVKDGLEIIPIKKINQDIVLDVRESGSTLRFLLPVVCALGIKARFIGANSITKRPINQIIDLLRRGEILIDSDTLPLSVEGQLLANDYTIAGDISSQFITGILLALPIIAGTSSLTISGKQVSTNYIDITTKVLDEFGVIYDVIDNKYSITDNASYTSLTIVNIGGDWSSACFPIASGVLCGRTIVRGMDINSTQGDRIILDLLRKMQAKIVVEDNQIIVTKSPLQAITCDVDNYPDIVPILSVLCASAKGTSYINNVDRLRIKESDRLQGVIDMLLAIGIQVEYNNNSLKIQGGKMEQNKVIYGNNDHRMTLSGIIIGLMVGATVTDIESISKSYPTFVEDIRLVGGIL